MGRGPVLVWGCAVPQSHVLMCQHHSLLCAERVAALSISARPALLSSYTSPCALEDPVFLMQVWGWAVGPVLLC